MNQQQAKFLTDLASIGLANAASAFSMMTNDRVTFKAPDFNENAALIDENAQEAQLLFTPFIGDVLFESYLIVSKEDAIKIASTMLPKGYASKNGMAQAALLELDNVISAAIATKFSDLLQSSVTGDVPRAYVKSKKELSEYIDMRLNRFDSYASCHTRFKLIHTKAKASFIFLFKSDFGEKLASIETDKALCSSVYSQASQEARRFLG